MARVNQALFIGASLFASVQHVSGAYSCITGYKLKTDGNCLAGVCSGPACCEASTCGNVTFDALTEYLDHAAATSSDCKKTKTACTASLCTGTNMVLRAGSPKCDGTCTSDKCCERPCVTADCTTGYTPVTGSPKCKNAVVPCDVASCCVAKCSDHTCKAYNKKKSGAGSCTGATCGESECCEVKSGVCQNATTNCPSGKSAAPGETMGTDAAKCCVADTKCSAASSGGAASGAVGTDIAGSALLLLIAMAVA